MGDMMLEEKINDILEIYMPTIINENSILKGDLLDKKSKEFILNNANAFIIGLISDQSVKAELAWSLPYNLYKRLGCFDFEFIINNYNVYDIEKIIKDKPALHRFPSRMANYIYEAMKMIVYNYDGDASNIWKDKDAEKIIERFEDFKGISHKKASLGTLLLVRDMDIDLIKKEKIDIAYDVHIRRLFLRIGLVLDDKMEDVLSSARKIKPEFPGELTTSFWTIGRKYCHSSKPDCDRCPLNNCCKRKGIYNEEVGV